MFCFQAVTQTSILAIVFGEKHYGQPHYGCTTNKITFSALFIDGWSVDTLKLGSSQSRVSICNGRRTQVVNDPNANQH